MSNISKFGMLELSRQKKQSTIQEISYTACPFCKGTGFRPSLEYTALSAFRKIESQAVKRNFAALKVSLPYAVSDYLLNQKRMEISRLEAMCEMSIYISGHADMQWDEIRMEHETRDASPEVEADRAEDAGKETTPGIVPSGKGKEREATGKNHDAGKGREREGAGKVADAADGVGEAVKKKSRRRSRHRRKKSAETAGAAGLPAGEAAGIPANDVDRAENLPAQDSGAMALPDKQAESDRPGVEITAPARHNDEVPEKVEAAGGTVEGRESNGGSRPRKIKARVAGKVKAPANKIIAEAGGEHEAPALEAGEPDPEADKAPRRKRRPPGRTAGRRKKTPPPPAAPGDDGEAPATESGP